MPTAKLINKRGGSSSDTSLVVELVASSSSGGISHSQEIDKCNVGKDASISIASSQSKNKIHKEKMFAKKSQPAVKKRIRKNKRCNHEGCTNQAVRGGVCVTHGAKRYVYICSFEECTNQALKGGVCITHGATKKRCSFEGCTNKVVKGGVCITHGAKKKQCIFEGCNKNARGKEGLCITHGANVPTKQLREESVSHMVPRGNDVATKVVCGGVIQ
jgi:hypothetical protein